MTADCTHGGDCPVPGHPDALHGHLPERPFEIGDQRGGRLFLAKNTMPDGRPCVVVAVAERTETLISVDVALPDVRKVTDAMHERAGLPDPLAELKRWLEASAAQTEGAAALDADRASMSAVRFRAEAAGYRKALAKLGELEAGR